MNSLTKWRTLRLSVALGLTLMASTTFVGCGSGTKVASITPPATSTLQAGDVVATIRVPRSLGTPASGKTWYGQATLWRGTGRAAGTAYQISLPVAITDPAILASSAPTVPVTFSKVARGVYTLELKVFTATTAAGPINMAGNPKDLQNNGSDTNPSPTAVGSTLGFQSSSELQVLSDSPITLTSVITPQKAEIMFDMDVFGVTAGLPTAKSARVRYGLVSTSTISAAELTLKNDGAQADGSKAPTTTSTVALKSPLQSMEPGTYQAWIDITSVDPGDASLTNTSNLSSGCLWTSNIFTFDVAPGAVANPMDSNTTMDILTPTVQVATPPAAPGAPTVTRNSTNNILLWAVSSDDKGVGTATAPCSNGYVVSRKTVVTGGAYATTPWVALASIMTSATTTNVATTITKEPGVTGTFTPTALSGTGASRKLGLTLPEPAAYTTVYYKVTPFVLAGATKVYGPSSADSLQLNK